MDDAMFIGEADDNDRKTQLLLNNCNSFIVSLQQHVSASIQQSFSIEQDCESAFSSSANVLAKLLFLLDLSDE